MVNEIARIQTWGTEAGYLFGFRKYISDSIRGENIGHASIQLQLAYSPENWNLIDKYCDKIPCELKSHIGPDGKLEQYYSVRFSFVRSGQAPFSLIETYSEDCRYERAGHHTSPRHALETSDFPERRAKTRNITIFQACTLTPAGRALDFRTAKGKSVLNVQKILNLEDQLKTAQLLTEKINKIDTLNTTETTIFLAAKALDISLNHLPDKREAARLVEEKVTEIYTEIKNLKEKNQDLIHTLESEGEEQFAKALSIQTTDADKEAAQLNDYVAYQDVLNKMDKLSKDMSITKESLFSELKQIQDRPVLAHFKSYGLIPIITSVLKNTDVTLDRVKEALSSQAQACHSLLHKDHVDFETKIRDRAMLKAASESTFEAYLCSGRPPDGEIALPIGTNGKLDLESMLKQMKAIVDSNYAYHIQSNNCSVTVSSILEAGVSGKAKGHVPTPWYQVTTPQMVFNRAVEIRDTYCKQMTNESIDKLDDFYANHRITALERPCKTLPESIKNFAADIIFPDENDVNNGIFYRFSEEQRNALKQSEDKIISTELLHDLWGLIPERSLPLVSDGSVTILIDHNLRVGDLMQGLSVLAQINSEKRLAISPNKTLRESIKNLTVDILSLDEDDISNDIFYRLEEQRNTLNQSEDTPISPELLEDLWKLIPEKSLPLVTGASDTIPIDHKLTMGKLMEGLSVLAQINAEKRLATSACKTLHEFIKNFTADNIVPDVNNDIFYQFSEQQRNTLDQSEYTLISTELLDDLLTVIPKGSLPALPDGSVTIPIDQNLTVGDLMHGLRVLAEINSEKKLATSDSENPTSAMKRKLGTILNNDSVKPANEEVANINRPR